MPLTLEVSLSPALYPFRTTTGKHITAVIDVLRFTTSVISAFDNGVEAVIPVASLSEAEEMKQKGYLVAAERDGLKLPFADLGNSATDFMTPEIKGKTIAYSTTNGTVAMGLASLNGRVVATAFTNLISVTEWLANQQSNVVILCSGWKNLPSIEDTLCAGALVELLTQKNDFTVNCDSAKMALEYWALTKNNLRATIENTSHYKRLIRLGVDPLLSIALQIGSSDSVPVYEFGRMSNFNFIK